MKTIRNRKTGIYLNLATVRVIEGSWCVKGCFNFRFKEEPDLFSPNWKTFAKFEVREEAVAFAEVLAEAWKVAVIAND